MQLKETKAAAKELLSELPIKKPRRLKRSDFAMLIFSFVTALFLWVYIASSIMPDVKKQYKLPVKADLTGTRAESYRLSLLPESAEKLANMTVDVTITGTRAAIGGLRYTDCEAYVDFDSDIMDKSGVQVLPIKVRTTNGAQFSQAQLSVNYVSVNMDRYETKQVPVKDASYPNLKYDDETVINKDKITYSPSYAEIRGPSTELAQIDYICVNITEEAELTQTTTFPECSDYTIMDAKGNPLNQELFQNLTTGRFSVTIPVRYSRTLPVSIQLTNVPDEFDTETVYQAIRIVGSKEYTLPGYGEDNMPLTIETDDPDKREPLDTRSSYPISIALSNLVPGKSVPDVEIPMSDGYDYPDKITSITVKLDDTDLTTKSFWLKNSEIELQNKDDRYSYDLKMPEGNTQVTLCGTPEDLAKIDGNDLKAYVNAFGMNITKEGEYNPAITVTIPKNVKTVWVGNPKKDTPPTLSVIVKVAN